MKSVQVRILRSIHMWHSGEFCDQSKKSLFSLRQKHMCGNYIQQL